MKIHKGALLVVVAAIFGPAALASCAGPTTAGPQVRPTPTEPKPPPEPRPVPEPRPGPTDTGDPAPDRPPGMR